MNPAGELTLADLMLTLAERHGQTVVTSASDSTPVVTPDPGIRDRLLRAINNGRREVYRRLFEARCFTPRITITCDEGGDGQANVDADAAKYRLPFGCHSLAGGVWTWRLAGSVGLGGEIQQRHPNDLAALHHAGSDRTGGPYAMALVTQALAGPSEPGRRAATYLWLYPTPDQAYTIEGQARVQFEPLTTMTDLEPMGQQHLDTVLAFATREWLIGRCEPAEWSTINQRCDEAIAISRELDNQLGPQSMGPGRDPEAERDATRYIPGRYYPSGSAIVSVVSGQSVL